MADRSDDTPIAGRDLQQSQSGGGSGEFGGNRVQDQKQPVGGGATASDRSSAGGSSGTGGYGKSENVVEQRDVQPEQGSEPGLAGRAPERAASSDQSRGERYDEEQGGGRGVMFDGSGGVSDDGEDDEARSKTADFERESD
jgi:hypothetical protein